jgi:hypothetical protein
MALEGRVHKEQRKIPVSRKMKGDTRQHSWLRHYTTSRKARVRFPMSFDFFNFPNSSSCTMVLGSTHPLTEMSTRNFPGDKGRPARKTDNLTAICEPTV